MRLLLTGDWHMDAVTAGLPRFPEIQGFVEMLCGLCDEKTADVVALLGDFFDPGGRQDCHYAAALIRMVRMLSEHCGQVIVIAGNHDVIHSSEVRTTIDPLAAAQIPRVAVFTLPGVMKVGKHSFLLMPYVSPAAYRPEMLDDAIEELGKARPVILGHWTVAEAEMGSESKEMARGRDMVLPVERLQALKPRLVANGHYHIPQRVGPLRVVVPGSPLALTFGEGQGGQDRGVTIVEG